MSNQDRERERIRRIRERQIQARDPRASYRKTQRAVARRSRRRYKRLTVREIFTDIPHKWKGFFFGVMLGALFLILIPVLWENVWAEIIGFASIPILALIGFAFGQAFELRDELRDFSRRK